MDTRILLTGTAGSQDLSAYQHEGGYQALAQTLQASSPEQILNELEASGLRGRGGASFPTARKWRLASERDAKRKFVLANGGEHEPGSDKDKHLVEFYPHKVLEGILLCGYATGASFGYLYLIEDMEGPIAAAEAAVSELRDAALLGKNILNSTFDFDIEIHRAPTTYVAGEETAAIESIEGREAKPRVKPPYPGEQGLFGDPTTVNNVETLAHVPWILRNGAGAYQKIGTDASKGTMLFTLGPETNKPGVYELPFGSSYRDLIYGCGGGPRSGNQIRAILPAMSCALLSAEHLDMPICYETMKAAETSPGCGGVRFIEEGEDLLSRILEIAQFFMAEQCGLCPPCRMETNQIVHILNAASTGAEPAYQQKLHKLTSFARGKGRCSLIEMAAAPVLSAMRLFPQDFAAARSPS